MTALHTNRFLYDFWLALYYRTFNRCAFRQMVRYHTRLAQLHGLNEVVDD